MTGKTIPLKNCKQPKMGGRGRTWDVVKSIVIKGEEVEMYCDTTWGLRFYFAYNHKWYSGEVWDLDNMGYKEKVELQRGK